MNFKFSSTNKEIKKGQNLKMPICKHCNSYINDNALQDMMDREEELELLGIRSRLVLAKESMDLKIICKGKTFECHTATKMF